jgi:hypothetical protein
MTHFINDARTEDLNERIALRNVPSSTLQPQFSLRPVATKYAMLPIFDQRASSTVPLQCYGTFDTQQTFNPGTAQGPWCGFAKNINSESMLRNQYAALQKAGQAFYIPPTTSDLYVSTIAAAQASLEQPFPYLFEEPVLAPFNPNKYASQGVGINMFENSTRVQIRNV